MGAISPFFVPENPMRVLVSRRLTIRPPLAVDGDFLAAHVAAGHLALPGSPEGADVTAWLAGRCAAGRAGDGLTFTLHREQPIGAIAVDGLAGTPRLAVALARPWAGRGLMEEGLVAVLAALFSDRPQLRLLAEPASEAVLRAAIGGGSRPGPLILDAAFFQAARAAA